MKAARKVSVKDGTGLTLKHTSDPTREIGLEGGTHTLVQIPNPYSDGDPREAKSWWVLKGHPYGRSTTWWNKHQGDGTYMFLPVLD